MELLNKAILEISDKNRIAAINLIEEYINKTIKTKVEFNNEWIKYDHNKVGGIPKISDKYFVVNGTTATTDTWNGKAWTIYPKTITHWKKIILPIK